MLDTYERGARQLGQGTGKRTSANNIQISSSLAPALLSFPLRPRFERTSMVLVYGWKSRIHGMRRRSSTCLRRKEALVKLRRR